MAPKTSSNKEDKLPPPNAFLAVQVQSPEIHQRLVDVAGKILDYDASLAWALEPVVKSHITLFGLFLPTDVADPGCLSRIRMFYIPYPNFFYPGSASNNLTKRLVSKLSEV
jgi:hypothetical protein